MPQPEIAATLHACVRQRTNSVEDSQRESLMRWFD